MKTKQLKVFNATIKNGVNNEYPTHADTPKQPCLQLVVGQRTAGKSYLTSKMLEQYQNSGQPVFDVIYIITPSFCSNKAYFGKFIQEENIFEPTRDAIAKVIEKVEADRDEWEEHLKKIELYKKFKNDINKKDLYKIDEDNMISYLDSGFLDNEKPKWKYRKEEPPKSLLIMDDVLSSPAISHSSGLTKIATLNRHVAPLEKEHSGRSACGLGVIILTQTYRMTGGIGRCLRENVSLLTLFKNKQEKQVAAIKEELANVVDIDLFDKAYNFATAEKFGNLTIDFAPKCSTKTFRKNLNELIMFDEMPCKCNK